MKNVILIDFSITSESKLKSICDELKLNFGVLNGDRIKFKFYKVWIDLDSKTMIAYSTQKRPSIMVYTEGFEKNLLSMTSHQLTPVVSSDLNLDLDSILDKISKFGINSLLKEEKEFLDNASKA